MNYSIAGFGCISLIMPVVYSLLGNRLSHTNLLLLTYNLHFVELVTKTKAIRVLTDIHANKFLLK